MSCTENFNQFCQTLATSDPAVASQLGGSLACPDQASETLQRMYQLGRNQPEPPTSAAQQAEALLARAATTSLFGWMRMMNIQPPSHSADGMPKLEAQRGYALVWQTLQAIWHRQPLPRLAQQVCAAVQQRRGGITSPTPIATQAAAPNQPLPADRPRRSFADIAVATLRLRVVADLANGCYPLDHRGNLTPQRDMLKVAQAVLRAPDHSAGQREAAYLVERAFIDAKAGLLSAAQRNAATRLARELALQNPHTTACPTCGVLLGLGEHACPSPAVLTARKALSSEWQLLDRAHANVYTPVDALEVLVLSDAASEVVAAGDRSGYWSSAAVAAAKLYQQAIATQDRENIEVFGAAGQFARVLAKAADLFNPQAVGSVRRALR